MSARSPIGTTPVDGTVLERAAAVAITPPVALLVAGAEASRRISRVI